MTRDAKERVADIRDAIESIRVHVGGSLESPGIPDQLVLDAVLFNLIVIGEAAKGIDDDLRSSTPEVPWADVAGLRDIITHQYFRVQKQIVEDTVRNDLPALQAAIQRMGS